MADFEIARAEFAEQVAALLGVVDIIDAVARRPVEEVLDPPLPEVPRTGQNTISAAAIVMLAARFEEYIRQQVQEYCQGMIAEIEHLEPQVKTKLLKVYWRGGVSRLNRIDPNDGTWASDARASLQALIRFPVDYDFGGFDSRLVTEHDNNMRWDTVLELSGRVGIKKLADRLFKHSNLRDACGVQKSAHMTDSLRQKLNDFYQLRNTIVHSISQASGIGRSIVEEWCAFFGHVSDAVSVAFGVAFHEFAEELKVKEEGVERRSTEGDGADAAMSAGPGDVATLILDP
jgi:hypothetical protein